MTDFKHILNAIEEGDAKAADPLFPMVGEELRILTAQKLSRERPGQTLQATDLVHEAYIRLVGTEDHGRDNQRAFFQDFSRREGARYLLTEKYGIFQSRAA